MREVVIGLLVKVRCQLTGVAFIFYSALPFSHSQRSVQDAMLRVIFARVVDIAALRYDVPQASLESHHIISGVVCELPTSILPVGGDLPLLCHLAEEPIER